MLTVCAETQELRRVRRFVAARARNLGIEEPAVSDLVLAVDEAVTNTIQHGYRDAAGRIEVRIDADDGGIVVHILDDAPTFDPTSVPAPDLNVPIEERAPGGMGLFLVRQLVDGILHHERPQGGNELILVKNVEGRAGA